MRLARHASVLLLAMIALACFHRPAAAVLHAGDLTPNFTKLGLDGHAHSLYDYRGKVVMLFLLGYS